MKNLKRWRVAIRQFLLRQKVIIPNPQRILEIGVGGSTNIIRKMYPDHIIDIADAYAEYKPTIVMDACTQRNRLPSNHYDLIVCCDVLEHCKEPFALADNITYWLNNNGYAIITVPCFFEYHAMSPVCDDYWRFLPSAMPLLFPKLKIISNTGFNVPNNLSPIGVLSLLKKE
jgi:hypothetical protein